MRLLLATHIFLWFISGDSRLTVTAKGAIQDPANMVYLSVVSVWETIIKYQLGISWANYPCRSRRKRTCRSSEPGTKLPALP